MSIYYLLLCPFWEIWADVFLQFSSPLDEPIFVHLLYWHTSNEHVIGIGYLLPLHHVTHWDFRMKGQGAAQKHHTRKDAEVGKCPSDDALLGILDKYKIGK